MSSERTSIPASSPVDAILDKENFTLEELLDARGIVVQCKALNSRLINFLGDRAQVEQLLRYIVEESSEKYDSKRDVKFPLVSFEIFKCEIDVILKTLVEEDELMDLLFSFLEPNRPHSKWLGEYFSQVVVCLMTRKTSSFMDYLQAHQNVFCHLVDLISIKAIKEVLIWLVGADDHVYSDFVDATQWLADTDLLEMIVDKLRPSCPPKVHANAAETLCRIILNAPSALAVKLSSQSFVSRIFGHALEDPHSKSSLEHALSVCISLLDRRRSVVTSPLLNSFESPVPLNQETISAMLRKLDHLLMLLEVSSDEKILPTTFGELKPPFGKHRLKVVEFISVLLKAGNGAAEKELVSSGNIQRVLDPFFEYPYNNALHHHVESIIVSCLESKDGAMVDHLLRGYELIGKILRVDNNPYLSGGSQRTLPAAGKQAPRAGNIGHITRISNRLVHIAARKSQIKSFLQEYNEWNGWQASVLQERNAIGDVYHWTCGRPTALHDKMRDTDEDDLHNRDNDVADLAYSSNQAFTDKLCAHDGIKEDHGVIDRNEEDINCDNEPSEVVSSLRFDELGSVSTNSSWSTFQEDRSATSLGTTPSDTMEDFSLHGTPKGGDSSGDDDIIAEADELTKCNVTQSITSTPKADQMNRISGSVGNSKLENKSMNIDLDMDLFRLETQKNAGLFSEQLPECAKCGDSSKMQPSGCNLYLFTDSGNSDTDFSGQTGPVKSDAKLSLSRESMLTDGSPTSIDLSDGSIVGNASEKDGSVFGDGSQKYSSAVSGASQKPPPVPLLFEEDRVKEFNDVNYWRIDLKVAVLE